MHLEEERKEKIHIQERELRKEKQRKWKEYKKKEKEKLFMAQIYLSILTFRFKAIWWAILDLPEPVVPVRKYNNIN